MLSNMRIVNINDIELNLYEIELLKVAFNRKNVLNDIKNPYDRFSPSMVNSLNTLEDLGFVATTIKYTYCLTNKGYEWIKNYVSSK